VFGSGSVCRVIEGDGADREWLVPRRCTAEGEWFTSRAEGKNREDPLRRSADGCS